MPLHTLNIYTISYHGNYQSTKLDSFDCCVWESLCSVSVHTADMIHNSYPTLSETLTGLAFQLEPSGLLLHFLAD